MIDRRRQSSRCGLLTGRKENRCVKSTVDMHRDGGRYDSAVMHGARTMRTRSFLVMRVRLRSLRSAVITAQISNGIGDDVACKCAEDNNAGKRKEPRFPSDVHRIPLLAFSWAAVKP